MKKKVNLVLIASGGGTDAFSIMDAYRKGLIPGIVIVGLISTMEGAGCLEKAKRLNISGTVISRRTKGTNDEFNRLLAEELKKLECQLVFLVGCIANILPVYGIKMYNIHPADIEKFGGKGMYGLAVHKAVLKDVVAHSRVNYDDFYTYPTVHEAILEYDSGEPLMRVAVRIPRSLLLDFFRGKTSLEESAELLQKHVLRYEWRILPKAVEIAAQQIIDNSSDEF